VSVVGDWNAWDGRRHPMRRRGAHRRVGDLRPGVGDERRLQVRDRGAAASSCLKADRWASAPSTRRNRVVSRQSAATAGRIGVDGRAALREPPGRAHLHLRGANLGS
jgi:hypothetical protein